MAVAWINDTITFIHLLYTALKCFITIKKHQTFTTRLFRVGVNFRIARLLRIIMHLASSNDSKFVDT